MRPTQSELPPYEMNGSVIPIIGTRLATTAIRQESARRVARAERDADAAERDHEEEHDHGERPGEPELVPQHGEDRVGVRRRQEAELLASGTEALAEQSAQSEPVQRLDGLETRSTRIAPRIEERHQARQAVGLRDRDRERADRGESRKRGEHPEARTSDEVHRERDRDDDDRGTEVRLGDDQRAEQRGHREERHEHRGPRDLRAPSAKPRGQIEDERELRELRRLQADRARSQPAGRAARAHTDPGDEHEDEKHHDERHERDGERAIPVVVDAHRGEHPEEPERGPESLPREVVPRVVERVERADPARAVDHRDPKQGEREDDE